MIIFDTDILSMFAKANVLDVIVEALSRFKLCITPKIKEELSIPLEYGYSFPEEIFKRFEVIVPTKKEYLEYEKLLVLYPFLGKGELEAISIAKMRNCLFATNDLKAFNVALKEKVLPINVHNILKILWEKKFYNKSELLNFIQKLERADNTKIKDIDKIFTSV